MEFKSMLKHFSNNISKTRDILLAPQWICREMGALKIEKICSSPKVIQPLLEPFEQNLSQNSPIKRLFQPYLIGLYWPWLRGYTQK